MISRLAVAATALATAITVTAAPSYQSNPERAEAVKATFQRSWDGYYEFAFPHDTLKPISKTFEDDRFVSIFLHLLFSYGGRR